MRLLSTSIVQPRSDEHNLVSVIDKGVGHDTSVDPIIATDMLTPILRHEEVVGESLAEGCVVTVEWTPVTLTVGFLRDGSCGWDFGVDVG